MIRLLDLPGVPQLEARVRLNATARVKAEDWDLTQKIAAFIEGVLGIEGAPDSLLLEHYYAELLRLGEEAYFAEYCADDGDEDLSDVDAWLAEGWDIRGENGKKLLCFELIEDAIQCLESGVAGRSKTELEAMIWAARHRAEARPSLRERTQSQGFLKFGQRRRRGGLDGIQLGR